MPDFTSAQQAENLHSETTRGLNQLANIESWERLLGELLSESSNQSIVFVVDALDECESPRDAERLLEFVTEIMENHSNVQLLCSSRQHVRVEMYCLPGILHKVELTVGAATVDMKAFVNGEIFEYLRGKIKDSIFCK